MIAGAKKFNERKYGRLLASTLPSVIESDEELERLTEEIDRLVSRGDGKLSPEEDRLLGLLVRLVEDYESEHYQIPEAPPHEVLKFLMEQRGTRQRDLIPIFGTDGRVSEVVNGKRSISKEQAKRLAEHFGVSAELFI
jgi:HTH-type transcriptional regulator/antitoxin HigA